MSFWSLITRGGEAAAPGGPSAASTCPHCGRVLGTCGSCGGSFDNGRLCQHCMYGVICPGCLRHWTWN